MKYDIEAHEQALQMVRDAGLDPDLIRQNGINEDGYDEFILDEGGNRRTAPCGDGLDADAVLVVRRAWPEGFRYDEFAQLFSRVWTQGREA